MHVLLMNDILADLSDDISECILPCIHLYDSDTRDYFVHHTNTFVCELHRSQTGGETRMQEGQMKVRESDGKMREAERLS